MFVFGDHPYLDLALSIDELRRQEIVAIQRASSR